MTDATYSFLPWLRAGMASEITRPAGTATPAPRADVDITLAIDAAGDRRDVTAALALFGPGEVAGIDPNMVIRVAPTPGEVDAEPDEFPLAEIGQADFPWRYTPATADARGRLRPWLVLAVLADGDIDEETPAGGDGRLPALTVRTGALPRLDQSWAWAHVQVEGFDPASESLTDVLRTEPRRVRARLLAPRRLAAHTTYTAVLVPAFERGRRAGLHEPLGEDVDGLEPAWTDGAAAARLPVYYRWSFQTGEHGDFEQLARRLRARAVGPEVGQRDLDARTPDPALPPASAAMLPMEGALLSPAAVPGPWDPAEQGAFVAALAALLNRPADALETEGGPRTVAPPLWGRWHAAAPRLDPAPGARPAWFHELNADPRLRATAGLGSQVVRRNDEQLMAGAWDQVEGVLAANEALRRAQLAREAAAKVHANHFARLDTSTFLEVSAPLHARFAASPVTVRERLRTSPVPDGTLDGQFRRVRRPGGGVRHRLDRAAGGRRPPDLLARLNAGELRPRPPAAPPEGALVPGPLVPEERARRWWRRLRLPRRGRAGCAPALALLVAALVLLVLLPPVGVALLLAALVVWLARRVARRRRPEGETEEEQRRRGVLGAVLTPEEAARIEPPPGWRPGVAAWLLAEETGPATHRPVPVGDGDDGPLTAEAVRRFRQALAGLVEDVGGLPANGPVLRPVDLAEVSTTLLARMDPRQTIPHGLGHRLQVSPWVTWEAEDPLEPIMAAPEFDQPMYEPLRDLGQDWLLPGVGDIAPDTVTLVVSNQRFVEAYMAGLSYEMARELLYHEYPTDQRGTYFKQFWDSRGAITASGGTPDPGTLRDIGPIHGWRRDAGLGANSGRVPVPRERSLVLLVKGELLRRYPHTIVYAVPAVLGAGGRRTLGSGERFPIFEGRLDPDMSFFGFDLLPSEVRGSGSATGDQGWFFVLAEHPGETRFGLDADNGEYGAKPVAWSDLNWAHLASSEADLAALDYVDLDAALPDTSAVVAAPGEPAVAWHATGGPGASGANGSDLAWITLRRPFRVAIHGSDMLPGDGS